MHHHHLRHHHHHRHHHDHGGIYYQSVIIAQKQVPTITYERAPTRASGDHFFALSVLLTVIFILCGTWVGLICTIPAIYFAANAQDAERLGDDEAVSCNRNTALCLNCCAIMTYVAAAIVVVILIVSTLNSSASSTSSYVNYCYTYYNTYYNTYSYYC
ncbi:PREDICTED: uncharacterized protein LOC109581946 [Amphimedon queenslandica]|uniref:Uncharacterized protein n=1 Tax=Amphimedon queenslandica TaxID=400682 RepID=A0AAN0J4S6_AMPQE|nr:PREDICTED: uncharacterized protein LOC109581946 [Amphimedon queenslandica]|eukprot:XP_019852019.1 PREDICTED: uncharacterized protein LOC109581946 [Amphimedon queenslandica]